VRENPPPAADVDEGGADGADVADRADGDVGGSKDAREAVVAHPPAEDLVAAQVSAEELSEPAVAAGTMVSEVLSFGDTVERLLEVLLVVLVGVALGMHWNWAAVPLAVALFVAIRPLSAMLLLARTPTTQAQRGLMGWFGIRGIGSLYYVSYALNHGAGSEMASEMVGLTVSVIALSVVVHGMTARPILAWYERTLERGDDAASKAERATGSELGARQAATRS
jgi:NhaP-type Na+/H+ or K+/H+ antiporter